MKYLVLLSEILLSLICTTPLVISAAARPDTQVPKEKEIKIEKKELLWQTQEKTALEILQKVELVYKNARNFQARYNQKVKKPNPDKGNMLLLQSSGKFYRAKEYLLHSKKWKYQALWSIESPVYYRIMTNFETLWLHNPIAQLVQVQAYHSFSAASVFINDLLMGKLNLEKTHDVSISLENLYKIELKPKNVASNLTFVKLRAHPLHFWVEELWIETSDGSTYELNFHSVQKDVPQVPELAEVFTKSNQFLIPQGVSTAH
ncbi:MAG: outer membrane lipoprotein carrier protein LolA [Deltaproteobacteria bacterium]|nr:outer membrane lipoprotein carrier protein LolA [Deltaproteobacteria bacterium]